MNERKIEIRSMELLSMELVSMENDSCKNYFSAYTQLFRTWSNIVMRYLKLLYMYNNTFTPWSRTIQHSHIEKVIFFTRNDIMAR